MFYSNLLLDIQPTSADIIELYRLAYSRQISPYGRTAIRINIIVQHLLHMAASEPAQLKLWLESFFEQIHLALISDPQIAATSNPAHNAKYHALEYHRLLINYLRSNLDPDLNISLPWIDEVFEPRQTPSLLL